MIRGMEVAVRCRQLRKTYDGGFEAVRGLDLEIRSGECFGLLGPNGAGKTTTIEILEGLLDPTSGEVEILGRHWGAQERELRELLGVTLQETRLTEKLTVRETLELFASFYRYPRPAHEVMEEIGLVEKADTWVGKLSGGQKQRLAVATALVAYPKILFLDEPTTGLDPQSRRQVWEIVRRFQARGGTVLVTTHYMDEAERLCDRVAIVDHGKLIAIGTPSELIDGIGGHHLVELETDQPLEPEAVTDVAGVRAARRAATGLALSIGEPHVALPALFARLGQRGARPTRLVSRVATLDDVFLSLTGRTLRED